MFVGVTSLGVYLLKLCLLLYACWSYFSWCMRVEVTSLDVCVLKLRLLMYVFGVTSLDVYALESWFACEYGFCGSVRF